MTDKMHVTTKDGRFGGYLAVPKHGHTGMGVVIAQEIFGVNAFLRDIADGMAEHGFIAFVPDLFWRIEPGIELTDQSDADWKRAFELFNAFKVDAGIDDIQSSISTLRDHELCNEKVGVMGFCLGGQLAALSACRTDAEAAISYYGVGLDQYLEELKVVGTPLMMHLAEEDSFVSKDAQSAIKSAVRNNPNVIVHSYAGREHAFARFGGAHFHADDAKLAASRGLPFFQKHLGG
jgi:carboxymethylenebutenolidase